MRRRRWLGLALAVTATPTAALRAQGTGVVVFAATSLKNALDEIAADWSKASSRPMPKLSFAASPALARQIEQGAPADLFISADLDWMDHVAGRSLIKPDSRVNLLGNKLVLIAPRDSGTDVELRQGVDIAKALAGGRLAMANVNSVPAGKYGKAALETLGAWEGVRDKIAQAENVRAALLFVARGEAPLGIVYNTDAVAERNVRIVATFAEGSHPPIIYPAALTKDSKSADARSFFDYLKSAKARPAFEKQGFTVLAKSTTST